MEVRVVETEDVENNGDFFGGRRESTDSRELVDGDGRRDGGEEWGVGLSRERKGGDEDVDRGE